MSSTAVIRLTNKEIKSNDPQVRAPRFSELTSNYNLKLKTSEGTYKIENISDTGVRVLCDGKPFEPLEVISYEIQTNTDSIIHQGSARVAWVNKVDDKTYAGIEFKDGLLPKGFLKSLDKLLAVEMDIDNSIENFSTLPQEYRLLVYDIKNFLSNLKEKIDAIEEEMLIESEETKKSLMQAIEVRLGNYIQEHLLKYGKYLFDYMKGLSGKKEKANHYSFFRKELNSFYLHSPYARRAMEKPRGYAGDFEMMNQVYRNSYEGNSLFGKLIHKYTVNESAAKSVRERRQYLKKELKDFIATESKNKNKISICSVACGSAQELADLLADLPPDLNLEMLTINLVDQDIEALLDARRNISTALRKIKFPVQIQCLNVSIKNILEQSPAASKFLDSEFDFIYSAGLYDYLLDPIAVILTQILYGVLATNGRLLIGNFHPDSPTRAICEFSVDWQLVYRDEKDMERLMKAIGAKDSRLSTDSQGFVVYINMSK